MLVLVLASCPVACFSDVTLPDCIVHDTPCVDAAGGSFAGTSGSGAHSGSSELAGNAGSLLGAGSSGIGGAAGSGLGGEAGEAGEGGQAGDGTGGIAGTPGAICRECKLWPESLPEPCESNDSVMPVFIEEGQAPFVWQIASPSSGWTLRADPKNPGDTRHMLLVRAASASVSPVTLSVTDGTGGVLVSSYAPTLRQACWFAYTSLVDGKGQLSLRDPVLEATPPLSLPHADNVFDFRFSPNGRFLAYRYGGSAADPASGHLTMIDLVTKFEWAVFPEQAVTAYAWADDSHALAVAYESKGITYLGGARVTPASPGTSPSVTQLVPVQAPVESELYWSADTFLAFHSTVLSTGTGPRTSGVPNDIGQRVPYFAKLGSAGFSTPVANKSEYFYPGSLWVRPTPNGFFVTSADDPYSLFYPSGGVSVAYHGTNLLSPRGSYSAELLGSSLLIFSASADATDPVAESSAAPGCSKLLSWAKDSERIACVNDVPASASGAAHGQLRLFDLGGGRSWTEADVAGACVGASCSNTRYEYSVDHAENSPRALSDSGRWLAFTARSASNDYLYWADLATGVPFLKRRDSAAVTDSGRAALAFSPDEKYLLQHRGAVLTVHALDAAPNSGPLGAPKLITDQMKEAPAACSEVFDDDPEHWCGASRTDLPFVWGPDSTSLALRTTTGLQLVSLDALLGFASRDFPVVDCSVECSNRFAFQPRP